MQDPNRDRGTFPTQKASQYLQQLCKHFGHKIEVTFDERSGEISFKVGKASLSATNEALIVDVAAEDAAGVDQCRRVIDSHLERFAFREGFKTMNWAGQAAA